MLQDSQKYLEIVRRRGEEGKELRRVFHNIRKPGLFVQAYGNLYANKGALTPGTDVTDTIDGMSLAKVDKIIESLGDNAFRWTPVRRVEIPKKKTGTRPLGLPNWTDKIVQEVIRLVLDAYYEPRFSNRSHAYRQGRGCHTALRQIKREWMGVKWFIEGDIQGCFDNLNHRFLVETIGKDVKDERFLKLLREMLTAGYLEDWVYHKTYSGIPQGGIASPLLSNIYRHELDKFVERELLPEYSKGNSEQRTKNPDYEHYRSQALHAKANGNREAYLMYRKIMQSLPSRLDSDDYRRLKYVRYADDFLLGFAGPKAEAQEIKIRIKEFLETIHLPLPQEKTLITHAASGSARFLGYDISIAWENSKQTNGNRSINGKPMLRVPVEVRKRWTAKYRKGKVTRRRPELEPLSDYETTLIYNADLLGLVNHYKIAVNVTQLYRIKWLMMQSLAKTIATKHKQHVSWAYRRYSAKTAEGLACFRVVIERENQESLVAEFGAKPIRYDQDAILKDLMPICFTQSRNELTARLLANQCELCGTQGPVQGHHIRKLADLKRRWQGKRDAPLWVQEMIARSRKTLFVCHECHLSIHRGTYDGRKLTS